MKRLTELFSDVDGNQRAVVSPLIQNAAFMRVTLEDLQEIILRDGAVEAYQNGEHQRGMKQSAAVQSYNSLIKNYAGVLKTLGGLLPPERKKELALPVPERSEEMEEMEKKYAEERALRIRAEIDLAAANQKLQREGRS